MNTSSTLEANAFVSSPLNHYAASWLKWWTRRDDQMSNSPSWKAATIRASRNEVTTTSLLADDCSRFDILIDHLNVKSAAVI